MIRLFLIRTLLFVVPFAIYALYFVLSRQQASGNTRPTPWSWLFITGLSLVALSFIIVGLTEGESTSGVYVAPHMENGRIVPGHVENPKKP